MWTRKGPEETRRGHLAVRFSAGQKRRRRQSGHSRVGLEEAPAQSQSAKTGRVLFSLLWLQVFKESSVKPLTGNRLKKQTLETTHNKE